MGRRLGFSLALFICLTLLAEPCFRLIPIVSSADRSRLAATREYFLGRRVGTYEPWPFVGFRLSATFNPFMRSDGFTSTANLPRERTRPSIRIAFIGGSTTASAHTPSGMSPGYLTSFPYLVEQLLHRLRLPVEVLNCGVPGWTSVENLIHYELSIQDYAPDWVVIHQGANDVKARSYRDFRSDYAHYRRAFAFPDPGLIERFLVEHSDLYVWFLMRAHAIPQDVFDLCDRPLPPPKEVRLNPVGLETFRRNTANLVRLAEASGARVLLTTESHNRRPKPGEETRHGLRTGMDEENEATRSLAREMHLLLADTEVALDHHGSVFTDYVHVTLEGNRIKARVIAKALLRAGLRDADRAGPRQGRARL